MGIRDLTISTLHPPNSKSKWTPPFQRLHPLELKFWGVFMFAGIMAGPLWIMYHMPDYRGGLAPHAWYLRKQRIAEEKEAAKSQK